MSSRYQNTEHTAREKYHNRIHACVCLCVREKRREREKSTLQDKYVRVKHSRCEETETGTRASLVCRK